MLLQHCNYDKGPEDLEDIRLLLTKHKDEILRDVGRIPLLAYVRRHLYDLNRGIRALFHCSNYISILRKLKLQLRVVVIVVLCFFVFRNLDFLKEIVREPFFFVFLYGLGCFFSILWSLVYLVQILYKFSLSGDIVLYIFLMLLASIVLLFRDVFSDIVLLSLASFLDILTNVYGQIHVLVQDVFDGIFGFFPVGFLLLLLGLCMALFSFLIPPRTLAPRTYSYLRLFRIPSVITAKTFKIRDINSHILCSIPQSILVCQGA